MSCLKAFVGAIAFSVFSVSAESQISSSCSEHEPSKNEVSDIRVKAHPALPELSVLYRSTLCTIGDVTRKDGNYSASYYYQFVWPAPSEIQELSVMNRMECTQRDGSNVKCREMDRLGTWAKHRRFTMEGKITSTEVAEVLQFLSRTIGDERHLIVVRRNAKSAESTNNRFEVEYKMPSHRMGETTVYDVWRDCTAPKHCKWVLNGPWEKMEMANVGSQGFNESIA